MKYHVSKKGSDSNPGTKESPFLTINKAASLAIAGDIVTVHEGLYREWVKPKNKGLSNQRRITYRSASGEKVVIKGSEQIKNWTQAEGTVWKTVVPNSFFGDFNPYNIKIAGDWLVTVDVVKHLGEVYLNGTSFYEAQTYDELINPQIKTEAEDFWTKQKFPLPDPEQTKYLWFAKVDSEETTIWANFHSDNPNEELTEINVRRSCFYPTETGMDYITVQGFEMAQAATPWTPPTADQPGLIGPNWAKGWIIEDNIIHDAKCSAVSIGKEASTGHNDRTIRRDKPGYQYQLEAVFKAKKIGWSKENIGSHIIRNNKIYDCNQNAVVGHLGCVFSKIYNNHIFNIAVKREFFGHEIAGIKLHAAIDVYIHHNRIHDCTLGLWSDWETQGTRISKNLLYNNTRDLFIEVSHGPYVVDHNILGSYNSLDNWSQGGAYVNNLICGIVANNDVLDRSTQYHLPHSTDVAGFSFIFGGDDRFVNNIFVDNKLLDNVDTSGFGIEIGYGTALFNGHPASLEEYIESIDKKEGDHDIFIKEKQPVYIDNNVYFNGAKSYEKEKNKLSEESFNPGFEITEESDGVYLNCELPKSFDNFSGEVISTAKLKRVRIVDAEFENPDGSDIILDSDFLDRQKKEKSPAGPLSELRNGKNKIKIW